MKEEEIKARLRFSPHTMFCIWDNNCCLVLLVRDRVYCFLFNKWFLLLLLFMFFFLFFKGSKIKLKKLENCGVLEENEEMKRAFEFDSLFGKEEKWRRRKKKEKSSHRVKERDSCLPLGISLLSYTRILSPPFYFILFFLISFFKNKSE